MEHCFTNGSKMEMLILLLRILKKKKWRHLDHFSEQLRIFTWYVWFIFDKLLAYNVSDYMLYFKSFCISAHNVCAFVNQM